MTTLLERVRAATGPSVALDRDICLKFDAPLEPYTASVDAILALIERELPEFRWTLYTDGGGKGPCALALRGDEPVIAQCYATTPALALCAAFLAAKIAAGGIDG